MLVDGAHQHLFFSEGAGNSGILVTDFDGQTVPPSATSRAPTA
jgi:hypothetical protein